MSVKIINKVIESLSSGMASDLNNLLKKLKSWYLNKKTTGIAKTEKILKILLGLIW